MFHTRHQKQRGVAHLLVIGLFVLVAAGIGGGAYVVYQRQQANRQQASSPAKPAAKSTSDSAAVTASPSVSKTFYSKVPTALQTAILAETKSGSPACVAGNRIVDFDKKPYDQPITYASSGYAFTGIGCDGGANYLFVKQIGGWTAVEHTQLGFSCKTFQQYNVPTDLVAAVDPTDSNKATCLDASGNETTYVAP